MDQHPIAGELMGVPAGSAADVEQAPTRLQPERRQEVVDLLAGALGERVPQICRTEMIGQRLEPVIRFRRG